MFSSPAELSVVRLTDAWFMTEVMRRMFRVYVKDVHDAARPADQPYFRASREKNMKGATLESFTAGRETHLPAIRTALAPLRTHLAKFPFLGGIAPNFADYIDARRVLLGRERRHSAAAGRGDALRDWLDRGFDLYGGIGRGPHLRPLFDDLAAPPRRRSQQHHGGTDHRMFPKRA